MSSRAFNIADHMKNLQGTRTLASGAKIVGADADSIQAPGLITTAGGGDNTSLNTALNSATLGTGTTFPAGGVQQVNTQGLRNTILYNSGSSNFQVCPESGYARITPRKAGSKILFTMFFPVSSSDAEGGSNVNPYYWGYLKRSINGGSFSNADFLGQDNSQGGPNTHIELSPMGINSGDNTTRWRYRLLSKISTVLDSPSYTLGNYIDYYLEVDPEGGVIQFGQPLGYNTDDNYGAQPYGFIMYEIAQ